MRFLGLLFLFTSHFALAHQSSITSSKKELRWSDSIVPIKVISNSSFSSANTLIDQSIAEWNAASGLKIVKGNIGTNQIRFSNDPTMFGSSVVGVTEVSYGSSGVINNAVVYLNEAQLSETRNGYTPYLKDVITHELGHFVGLGHSEVLNSSMFYMNFPGQSELALDDKAGIRAKYDSSYGTIRGYVKGGSSVGVLGVHVQAISRKTGEIISAISNENGFFSIGGLDLNDTYYLYTSPLKNLNALPGLYANVQSEFCPAAYVGSFFSPCSRDQDGLPQAINLTSSNRTVNVGVVTINCSLRAQEEYNFEKIQSVFSPISIFDYGDEPRYEKTYVGYFRKSQLSLSGWSDQSDHFQINLNDINPTGKRVRFRIISQPFGNKVEYLLTVVRNGAPEGTFVKTFQTSDGTWKLDIEALSFLSSTPGSNNYELIIQAMLPLDSVFNKSIPDWERFQSDQNLPYLLSVSIEDNSGPLVNTTSNLSDNSSCLDAPFTYTVRPTTAFAEEIKDNKPEAAAAAACGTIEPPSGPGPGSFLAIISLGFALSFLASELAKRGKNFLS